jgi:membrane-associated protease RseP (regulator of RpoE activity)
VKKTFLAMAFAILAAAGGLALADDANKPSRAAGGKQPYLGIGVEPLSTALSSHLSGMVPKGEGLLVTQVAKDSPAAKAGLQANDILVRYGAQPLHSFQQLAELVRDDKAGREIALSFVRGGKSETCKVALGERELAAAPDKPRVFKLQPQEREQDLFEEFEFGNNGQAWESFDALKLTRLDAKRWRAEIDFRDKEGKKEHKSFEGTREEIRKGIHAEKDMPANEQRHLLRALNLDQPIFEFHLPPFDRFGPDF